MITTDCPVGTKTNRKRGRISTAMLTVLAAPFLMVSAALAGTHFDKTHAMESLRNAPVVGSLVNKLSPQPVSTMTGAVAIAPSQTPPAPTPAPTPDEPIMGDIASVQPTMGKPMMPSKTVQPTMGEPTMGEPTMGAPLPPKQCPPK